MQVDYKKLQLLILAQALVDVLRQDLGLEAEAFDDYAEALAYTTRYSRLRERLSTYDKKAWLEELEDALGRSGHA
jgi:bacterioferritin (cytochrome b1)